jgi:hypothetical protein
MSGAPSNPPIDEKDEASLTPIFRRSDEIAERDPDVEVYRRYLLEKYGSGVVFPPDDLVDDPSTD